MKDALNEFRFSTDSINRLSTIEAASLKTWPQKYMNHYMGDLPEPQHFGAPKRDFKDLGSLIKDIQLSCPWLSFHKCKIQTGKHLEFVDPNP